MAIGRIGSFATDEPLQRNYIGDALSEVENQGFRYRAERKLMKDEEKAKIKEQEEKENALALHLKTFNVDKVGANSVDDPIQKFSFETFNKYSELERQLQNTTDPNERIRIKTLQAKLDQNINDVKQIPLLLKEKGEFIAKNYDKLNPDDVDVISERLKALEEKNIKVYFDENNNLKFNAYKTDENGNVTNVLEESKNLIDYVGGINPHMKSNFEDLLKKQVDNTATSLIKKQVGSRITETKGVLPEVEKERANSLADLVVSNPNELYAASKRYQKDINDIEGIKEAVRKDFKNALSTEYKEDIDSAYINAMKPDKSSSGEGKKETKAIISWNRPVVITSKLKRPTANYFGSNIPSGTKGVPVSGVVDDLGGGKKMFVRGIYASPGGKDFYIAVEESGFESTSTNQKGETISTTTSNKKPVQRLISLRNQADEFANMSSLIGYDDYMDLVNDIKIKTGVKNTQTQEPKKAVTTKKNIKGF